MFIDFHFEDFLLTLNLLEYLIATSWDSASYLSLLIFAAFSYLISLEKLNLQIYPPFLLSVLYRECFTLQCSLAKSLDVSSQLKSLRNLMVFNFLLEFLHSVSILISNLHLHLQLGYVKSHGVFYLRIFRFNGC